MFKMHINAYEQPTLFAPIGFLHYNSNVESGLYFIVNPFFIELVTKHVLTLWALSLQGE